MTQLLPLFPSATVPTAVRLFGVAAVALGLAGCNQVRPEHSVQGPSAAPALRAPTAEEQGESPKTPETVADGQPPAPTRAEPTSIAPVPGDVLVALTRPTCEARHQTCDGKVQGMVRMRGEAVFSWCREVVAESSLLNGEPLRHRDQIVGTIRVEPIPDLDARRCRLISIDARRGLEKGDPLPLVSVFFGEIVLGAKEPTSPPPDAYRVQYDDSGRARFVSVYLGDLEGQYLVPGHPPLSVAQIHDLINSGFERSTGRTVNGVEHFKPQVRSSRERWGFAKTPILELGDHGEGFLVVPVQQGETRRYLLMQSWSMRYSGEQANVRGRMIERIVEDGLTPIPEAM